MRKKIAIAMGGYSNEYEISLQSGKLVYSHLDHQKFEVYQAHIFKEGWFVKTEDGKKYPIDKADFSIQIKESPIHFDCVFNMIHGSPGEDGLLQAYLKMLNIPQTSSDFYPAALTFNKRDCISVLRNYGFKTAKNYLLTKGDKFDKDSIIDTVGLPCFVKANRAGSSFGISKVKQKSGLHRAIEHSFKEDEDVIIESFLSGTEVSVGAINYQGKIVALPVTEIVTENEFFDYDAKYFGESQEITPAPISDTETQNVQQLMVRIYKLLKLKGFARAEFIYHEGEPHFIEVNTIPGMSAASIVPQQLEAAGISLSDFFNELVTRSISL